MRKNKRAYSAPRVLRVTPLEVEGHLMTVSMSGGHNSALDDAALDDSQAEPEEVSLDVTHKSAWDDPW